MKKMYSKPEIMYESFLMSTNIAAGCELDTPLPSYEQSCGYPYRGGILFVVDPCTTTPDGTEHSSVCYHNPYDDNNLFNS